MLGQSEVYIVKDDEPARRALASLLGTAGIVSRGFDSGSAFLEACDRLPPGCVIASFQTRAMDASEFLRHLSAEPVSFPAIIIASGGDVRHAVEAMKAGAATVLERPYGDEVLLDAVRSALEVDAQAATHAAQRTVLATLTPREREVLSAMLDGKSNKMIARHLGISSRTVEIHRARVMEKSGVGSLAELVRLAIGSELSH